MRSFFNLDLLKGEEETESFDIVVHGEKLGAVVVSKSADRKAKCAAKTLCTIPCRLIGQILHTFCNYRKPDTSLTASCCLDRSIEGEDRLLLGNRCRRGASDRWT